MRTIKYLEDNQFIAENYHGIYQMCSDFCHELMCRTVGCTVMAGRVVATRWKFRPSQRDLDLHYSTAAKEPLPMWKYRFCMEDMTPSCFDSKTRRAASDFGGAVWRRRRRRGGERGGGGADCEIQVGGGGGDATEKVHPP